MSAPVSSIFTPQISLTQRLAAESTSCSRERKRGQGPHREQREGRGTEEGGKQEGAREGIRGQSRERTGRVRGTGAKAERGEGIHAWLNGGRKGEAGRKE